MSRQGTATTIAARWIFPVEGDPIEDACIDIRKGEIIATGPRAGRMIDIDYGNCGLTPGLINAHCHLELAALEDDKWQPHDCNHENEIEWLKKVVRQRWMTDPESYAENALKHAQHLIQSGTTLVADITTAGASGPALVDCPIRSVIFAEIIGLKRMRAMTTNEAAWTWINTVEPALKLAQPGNDSFRLRIGISPHAPYSTAGWLYHQSVTSGLPLTTHLAEMPGEEELLRDGTGPLREFLDFLGAWPDEDEWAPIGPRPLDYIRHRELRNADWLLAHCNYIDEQDLWQLSAAALKKDQRVAVAYCPRTSYRFGHTQNPYRKLLERGGIVCLGTDSLASSPSLSVLDEMRFLHRMDCDLPARLILAMATLFGAWALRADGFTGSLKPGKKADFALIRLPDYEISGDPDPARLLLESDLPVMATWVEGEPVFAGK
jgi:cytosine/adenosine deaminase-related metal-dependent hydrolase